MKQRRSPPHPPKLDASPLTTCTRRELLALARRHSIRGHHRMTKAQLIKALMPLVTLKSEKGRTSPSPPQPRLMRSYETLPESYGITELTLLPVDPYWIYAYWEVTPQTLSDVLSRLGSDTPQARYVLRIYDVTAIEFDGRNAHSFFDLPIELSARNWYINLWSSEKSLVADLGLLLPDGRFFLLARSNGVHTPREGASIFTEAPWAEPSSAAGGLGGQGPALFRFHSREPRYGPRPVYRATVSKAFGKRLEEKSRAITQGLAHPTSPGAHRIPT